MEMENVVAGEDLNTVERDMWIAGGFRSRRDDDILCLDRAGGAAVDIIETHRVAPCEGSRGGGELDIITHQRLGGGLDFVVGPPRGPDNQDPHPRVFLPLVETAPEL